ncbi:hypothetical protein [Bacillus sp. FJAT-29790]|nr:hypothetical protein [Bacillus sp. FJAT-29790]
MNPKEMNVEEIEDIDGGLDPFFDDYLEESLLNHMIVYPGIDRI